MCRLPVTFGGGIITHQGVLPPGFPAKPPLFSQSS